MPYYEYKCLECNKTFEVKHGIYEDAPKTIDECEKKNCPLERLISQVNFRVKGPSKNPLTRTGYVNYGYGKDYPDDG